ncbi:hypothetical protein ACFL9U_10970 [Thermodesulfobacteriota bacterium]
MIDKQIIPEEFWDPIRRLLRNIPGKFRDRNEVQKTLLLYLRLGGESLARQRIEIAKKRFPQGFKFDAKSSRKKSVKQNSDEKNFSMNQEVEDTDNAPETDSSSGTDSSSDFESGGSSDMDCSADSETEYSEPNDEGFKLLIC